MHFKSVQLRRRAWQEGEVCASVCTAGFATEKKERTSFPEFLNTLFQFQKEQQNNLPLLRG